MFLVPMLGQTSTHYKDSGQNYESVPKSVLLGGKGPNPRDDLTLSDRPPY